MASDSEAECEAFFINTREAILVRTKLEEMGNIQLATPMQFENSTCNGIMNIKIQQKCSKEMDIRFHCARYRVKQKLFDLFWKTGVIKLGDYFTKHHSPTHLKGIRPVYLNFMNSRQAFARVCYSK